MRQTMRTCSIIAQDPALRRPDGRLLMARIQIPREELEPGPIGHRVQVVDYNATTRCFHGAHVLPGPDDPEPRSWRDGSPALVTDHRFHAANVYALVMRTLARFEFALGRRIGWSFETHQLKVAPHGLTDANAYYSPADEGLVFGSFAGRSGETVHTCLSHDIVVHETTHALLDALRPRFMDPSTPDQAAFHEGFSDVIALLSVFALPEVVAHLLGAHGTSVNGVATLRRRQVEAAALRKSTLFALAEQMGSEIEGIRGGPLRQSAVIAPSVTLKDQARWQDPHDRGELFVAAVLHGFIAAWSDRILASGTPGQQAFPLRRVVEEGADIADRLATMWIRGIDYMPPVHLEFGDALSAALTGDLEVQPDDTRYQLRRHMRESFAAFGFEPASKKSHNADEPGVWAPPPKDLRYDMVRFESLRSDKDEVFRFIWENRIPLELREGAFTRVLSVRPSVRTGTDGFVVRETVAEYYQMARLTPEELEAVGVQAPAAYLRALRQLVRELEREPADSDDAHADDTDADADERDDTAARHDAATTPLYGGGILIFDEFGRVKYWVHNDVFGRRQKKRLQYLWEQGLLDPDRRGTRLRAPSIRERHHLRAFRSGIADRTEW